jgi:hypothetical protein
MPAISMQDLENAKVDVDHIAEVATSLAPTATDRLGHVKQTLAGAVGSIAAITDRGVWTAGREYHIKDLVSEAGVVYFCVAGHTSGTDFAGDVGNWREYQGLQIAAFAGNLADQTDPEKGAGMVGVSDIGGGRTQADHNGQYKTAYTFGAIGDGSSHPLSTRYETLVDAQAVYPHATALSDEIDWCALQAMINSITGTTHGTTWPGGQKDYSLGGGEVYFGFGQFRLNRGLKVGQHCRIRGCATKGYLYPSNTTTSGTVLLCDFANSDQWVISSANYNLAGDEVPVRGNLTGALMDNGVWNFTHGIEVKDIVIQAVSDVYGGIRLLGSPNSSIENVGIYGTDAAGFINASWGCKVDKLFSVTNLYGLIAAVDVNGITVNAYCDGQGSKTLDDSNRLQCFTEYDFGAGIWLPEVRYKKTGLIAYYTNSSEFNCVSQHWDVGRIYIHNLALFDSCMYNEACTFAATVSAATKGQLSGGFGYNPALSGGITYYFGASSELVLTQVQAGGIQASGGGSNSIQIVCENPDAAGWKYNDNVSFVGADLSVIRVSATGDANSIASDTSYTTISEAVRRIQLGSLHKYQVRIKDGDTVTLNQAASIVGKKLSFSPESTGRAGLVFGVTSGSPAAISVGGDASLAFDRLDVAYTSGTSASDPLYSAGLVLSPNAASNVSLLFKSCTFALQSSYCVVQQGYRSSSILNSAWSESTITGSGSAKILGGAYGGEARTVVINSQVATTASASVIATNNGWGAGAVLSSNFT